MRWYVLDGVQLPHRWILSRGTLKQFGYTDRIVALDELNDDAQLINARDVVQGYEGDDGQWLEKSYPLQERGPAKEMHAVAQRPCRADRH